MLAGLQQRTPRIYKYKMSRSTIDSSPSKMTAKTAEHDTVMGALRSAQDVIEGILNATQALLTSLTYPDSSTVCSLTHTVEVALLNLQTITSPEETGCCGGLGSRLGQGCFRPPWVLFLLKAWARGGRLGAKAWSRGQGLVKVASATLRPLPLKSLGSRWAAWGQGLVKVASAHLGFSSS